MRQTNSTRNRALPSHTGFTFIFIYVRADLIDPSQLSRPMILVRTTDGPAEISYMRKNERGLSSIVSQHQWNATCTRMIINEDGHRCEFFTKAKPRLGGSGRCSMRIIRVLVIIDVRNRNLSAKNNRMFVLSGPRVQQQ